MGRSSGNSESDHGTPASDVDVAPSDVAPADADDEVMASVSTEIQLAAGAITELQHRLERALSQMSHVTALRTTEAEIGRLFLEAQKFTETALTNLERQVEEVLHAAGEKAQRMVAEATAEAEQIRQAAIAAATHPEAPDEGPPDGPAKSAE